MTVNGKYRNIGISISKEYLGFVNVVPSRRPFLMIWKWFIGSNTSSLSIIM